MTKEGHTLTPEATASREATFRLILTDRAPKLSAVSDGVQALLGYPAADFLSGQRALPSLIHPDDRDVADPLFSLARPGGEGDCNLRVRQASGRILCVKGVYLREATADGVVLELQLQDAKSLPRTMPEARTSPMFAAMMENTDDYIYFKDRNHVFTGASQTLVALCSPATHWTDLLGQTDYDVFPEEFADIYYRLEKQVFAGLAVAREVQKTLGKDGQAGWVDNRKYPIRDASGVLIGLYGIARDITAVKQKEVELEASERRWKFAVEGSGDGLWDWNVPASTVFLSKRWKEMLGFTEAEIGSSLEEWSKRIHPDDLARVMAEVQAHLAGTSPTYSCEHRVLCKDGSWKWILDRGRVIERDAAGKPLRMIGTQSDITESKQAEAVVQQNQVAAERMRRALLSTLEDEKRAQTAVRERETRYGAMVNSISDAIISADSAGQIIGWNNGAESIFGYPESEILGQPLMLLLPARHHDRHTAGMARVAAGGPHHIIGTTVEVEGRRKDGTEFPLNLSLSEWQIGGRKFFTAIIRDITEHRARDARLRKLSAIIEQAPLSVIITDLNGTIEYVNPRFCLVTGYTPAEVLGRNPRMLKSGETPPEAYRTMWETLRRGEVWTGELRNRAKSGELYLETAVIAPVVNEQGRATHYVALKDDITAKKRHEAELTAKLAREHELSEMKTRFISVTSHEFRTPMAAAMGSVEILANHLDRLAPDKRRELLDRITSSLHRMTEMLDEILLLNRMDANRVAVRLTSVDLRQFTQNVLEEIRLGDRDAHRFELSATGETAAVVTDPNLLHHILSNLLSNAVRYSPAGTLITVRLDLAAGRTQIAVEDQGIGIPEADRARIFEPFERGSNVGSVNGTGLGLNIVRRMTGLLGGTVALAAAAGGGSRFTLDFPYHSNPPFPT